VCFLNSLIRKKSRSAIAKNEKKKRRSRVYMQFNLNGNMAGQKK